MSYKSPQECQKMADVRNAIDAIDEKIVDLLGERIKYIGRAAAIKDSENLIRDNERIDSMLDIREVFAEKNGYDPKFIRHLFNEIIEYSIAHEHEEWKAK